MHMGGGQGDLNSWLTPPGGGERSAAYRAHRRALREASHHQAQPASPYDSSRAVAEDGSWVMLFNAGQSNEGIYTHTQNGESACVIAFECADDADRFAQQLHAEGLHLATSFYWSSAQLSSFCRNAGLEVWLVPLGTLPAPPSNTFDPLGGAGELDDPGAGAVRRDSHTSYRLWLEDLFLQSDQCDDDDCIIR